MMTEGSSLIGGPAVVRPPLAQFYIPAAASLQERRPRTLKHGDTFAVFDHNGDVLAGPGSPEGLYYRDTRHLSHVCLSICGARPMLLSSTLREDNAMLGCDLTNPDIQDQAGQPLEHDVVHLRRSKFLWQATCYERIAVRNFGERVSHIALTMDFAADFVDLFEVRGHQRKRRGVIHPAEIGADSVRLVYVGLDGRERVTRLRFSPRPWLIDANRAIFKFDLAPGERTALFVEISCDGTSADVPPDAAFFASLRQARRALRATASRAAAVETSNEVFNEAIRRSVSDLCMLVTDLPAGSYPYAGIPWFSTVFGRDGLITAMQMLWMDPSIARGVLLHLAANQAQAIDEAADAEPGKILHETRQGEMAELGEVPFRRYYGSVDATPLYVMLASAYLDRTGDLETAQSLWPSIEAALSWIDLYGDADGDGFVEYGRRTKDGLVNQGWKDSNDSIFHADGTLAKGPIALVEVQGYVYAAKRGAAGIARRLGKEAIAASLERDAEALRARFDQAFWDDGLGCYALALDGSKRPCRVLSSNAGHALFTGIAYSHRVGRVVQRLTDSTMFSGWGIRTIASTERRYNPMSYHNGSVWPHDNALIAAGFARYGFSRQAAKVFERLFDASIYIELRRLPELFCGFDRKRSQAPIFYPVACSPQAWAAAAPLSLLQSCLGLGFDPEQSTVVFHRPVLPRFLDRLTLRGLSIGKSYVDVALRRADSEVAVHVLSRRGDIRVTTIS